MHLRHFTLWFVAALVAGACAARSPGPASAPTRSLSWEAPLDRDHPLTGRIYQPSSGRFVDERMLQQAVAQARFAVLGEKHDNPDHHRLQARLVEYASAAGRRPALVFEMLAPGSEDALARLRAGRPAEVDGIAEAVQWQDSGWPPFALYRPLFAEAVQRGLPLVAAGLDRDAAMDIARHGLARLDAGFVERHALATPLPAAADAELQREMHEAHCGLLPARMLPTMVRVQRVRDARMAEALAGAADPDGALLIAGNGHARNDRGVPAQLARVHGVPMLAIGLLEVQADWPSPGAYAASFGAASLPFDYVWFTPRANDDDPCEGLRKHGAGTADPDR